MLDLSSIPVLPKFDWQHVCIEEAQDLKPFAAYLNYYGIHFSESMAQTGVQHYLGLQALGGFDIAVHFFKVPDAVGSVVLSHGYMDHVGLYKHLIHALLAQGLNVLAYDLPGHGLSSGERAGIANFHCYQKVLTALLQRADDFLTGRRYMIAQSTGCSISMDYLLHNAQHQFEKAILLAPLVVPRKWVGIKALLFAGRYLLSQVKRDFQANSADVNFVYFLEHKDPLQSRVIKASWVNALDKWQPHFEASGVSDTPILIVQGLKDITVQWEYNLPAIKQHFSDCEEVIIEAANHQLVNEADDMRAEVLQAVKTFLH
ncbi:MAG: alpha/beta hydrolase [Pseudomonadales bacterium]|nr:alpha/beta hydrolase [Pseudomonadales bacterium]